jgi:hypothetical protein
VSLHIYSCPDTFSIRVDTRASVDGRANIQETKNACLALNTAEYCLTTSSQVGLRFPTLEEKLRSTIDAEYRDQVSFQAERDLFLG